MTQDVQDTQAQQADETAPSSYIHHAFTLERTYPAPIERVWAAFADPEQKAKWFGGGDAFDETEKSEDFRVGGHGVEDGQWHGGPRSRFVSTYTDIVELQRIVYTYDMWIDGGHLSTSLATLGFEAVAGGTRLVLTEQGVYFDGIDTGEQREIGTGQLLDLLGASLAD